MNRTFSIGEHRIGEGHPVYIVAELSANHGQTFETAADLIRKAKEAGADAVKLQTFTPDTITIDSEAEWFKIQGTAWSGRTLYSLYQEAYTPWEWHKDLKQLAESLGLDLFSTPFDPSAVEFLERLDVPALKIASCELVDLPLIERVARTGKPVILSTGMATTQEIEEAVSAAKEGGASHIALLKCTTVYPAPLEDMNLRTIPYLHSRFNLPVGLSDHTLGTTVPVAAVAVGACLVEKHFTLSRAAGGPDSAFSLEPHEFMAMVEAIRTTEKALGKVHCGVTKQEEESRIYRRSLFVVKDMKAGDLFTEDNVRSIRPGHGLPPKHLTQVLGRRAVKDISRGTPLDWQSVDIADPAQLVRGQGSRKS